MARRMARRTQPWTDTPAAPPASPKSGLNPAPAITAVRRGVAAVDGSSVRARSISSWSGCSSSPSATVDPDRALDLARLQEVFAKLAARLAPKQRAAFVLREIEGNETAEVARIMNVTESTVRNHLLQARRVLREAILKDYPELVPVVNDGEEADTKRTSRKGEQQ